MGNHHGNLNWASDSVFDQFDKQARELTSGERLDT
jgi:hypothetical protein